MWIEKEMSLRAIAKVAGMPNLKQVQAWSGEFGGCDCGYHNWKSIKEKAVATDVSDAVIPDDQVIPPTMMTKEARQQYLAEQRQDKAVEVAVGVLTNRQNEIDEIKGVGFLGLGVIKKSLEHFAKKDTPITSAFELSVVGNLAVRLIEIGDRQDRLESGKSTSNVAHHITIKTAVERLS